MTLNIFDFSNICLEKSTSVYGVLQKRTQKLDEYMPSM